MTKNRTEDNTTTDTAIRVNLNLLDTLMNLAGELVLSRNQLLQSINTSNIKNAASSSQRIDLITSELQEAIMKTRMQPIDTIFKKFRDLILNWSRGQEKSIDVKIQGKEVELDKTILESIHAPMQGLIRHLINQAPGKIRQPGSDDIDTLTLKGEHDSGQVNIIISDNSEGLGADLTAQWAVSEGLIAKEQADGLTDQQKLELIFRQDCPNTSGNASPLSIGDRIESLGGIVEINAAKETGTTIQIKLPLTLAIIPSQITSVGNERYALPQVNLDELIRIPDAQIKEKIEKVGDVPVVRLRGALLPLLDLASLLGIEKHYIDKTGDARSDRRKTIADRRSRQLLSQEDDRPEDSPDIRLARQTKDRRQNSAINIAVVSAGTYKYGLIVDQFHDSEEIVVKPLGRHLNQDKAYTGATIMGDGKVALILDISNLAQMAELSTFSETRQMEKEIATSNLAHKDKTALIFFKNAENEHFCAPLSRVNRIERILRSSIEKIGDKKVVQYRGGALPLYELSDVADVGPLPLKEAQEVIVFKTGNREVGLMVTPPVDTLEVEMDLDESTFKGPAISGSMIIKGNTTLLVDVDEMVEIVKPA